MMRRPLTIPPGQTKEHCPVCGRWIFFSGADERIPIDPNGTPHLLTCDDPKAMHRKLYFERLNKKNEEADANSVP